MTTDMVPTIITILTAIGTAVVAGVISYLAGRGMKSHEWRLEITRVRLVAREALYADFLSTASHFTLKAIDAKASETSELSDITQKYERISLVATRPVVDAASALYESVIIAHSATPDLTKERDYFAQKQTFVREVRSELEALTK